MRIIIWEGGELRGTNFKDETFSTPSCRSIPPPSTGLTGGKKKTRFVATRFLPDRYASTGNDRNSTTNNFQRAIVRRTI